jgi:hypothetical protein
MPACQHPDIQKFDGLRCCLSCGAAVFEDLVESEDGGDFATSPDYHYRRLNYELGHEIRLVVLNPGKGAEELRCDITHANLLDMPAYEAVSYTWATTSGNTSISRYVLCHGKKIGITENCDSLLRSLRRRGQNRTIWVDAICIDQSNIVERNHQVKLMATIYSNASQVVAYLGPDSISTNNVVAYLEDTSRQELMETPSTLDVAEFLHLPYFDRVWVSLLLTELST